MEDALQLNHNFIEKLVGKGGSSGIIYVPKEYIRDDVKVIIPAANGGLPEIFDKTVGRSAVCGAIYVHKKHVGKLAKIVFIGKV